MAAKKKTVKKKGKAMISMADMERMMEEDAEAEGARATTTEGNFISLKGGSFTYQGGDIGEEMEVVILDFANENAYYDSDYDPEDTGGSPACWSISKDKPVDMVPSELSVKQQCDDCSECWANEFGSAKTGRGKACSNTRRLAIVSADDLDNIAEAEVAFLKVPPTSNKAFDKMSNGVRKVHKRPLYGIRTRIAFDEESDYPKLVFTPIEPINDAGVLMALKELKKSVEDDIMSEPDPANYKEPVVKKPRGPKKKTAKKKRR